ncbi:MAG TPA: hypothetical protein VGB56_01945 [Flavisolibacter sp.]|jgi:hypothetical protein
MLSINKVIYTQCIDLWEAWIDDQVIGATPRILLYVMGEVYTDGLGQTELVRKEFQPEASELHLELVGLGTSHKAEEVYYSEVVTPSTPYRRVVVFYNGVAVAKIPIETLELLYA